MGCGTWRPPAQQRRKGVLIARGACGRIGVAVDLWLSTISVLRCQSSLLCPLGARSMPLLWGKTRCKEAAGWDDRILTKLMIAGAPARQPLLGVGRRQAAGGRRQRLWPQLATRLHGACLAHSAPVPAHTHTHTHAPQAARAPRWAACCRWCSSSRWRGSPPPPPPPSSCWPAASQVGAHSACCTVRLICGLRAPEHRLPC